MKLFCLLGTDQYDTRVMRNSNSVTDLRTYGLTLKRYAIYKNRDRDRDFHNTTEPMFLISHNDPYWYARGYTADGNPTDANLNESHIDPDLRELNETDVLELFIEMYMEVGMTPTDKRCMFNDYLDSLHRDGRISNRMVDEFAIPDELEYSDNPTAWRQYIQSRKGL